MGMMMVGRQLFVRRRSAWPLAVAAVSLAAGVAGLALTLPAAPELLSFGGYRIERGADQAGVVSEAGLDEAEQVTELVVSTDESTPVPAAPVFVAAAGVSRPVQIAAPVEKPSVAIPTATSTPSPAVPEAPVEAATYGGVLELPTNEQPHQHGPASTSTPNPTPTPIPSVTRKATEAPDLPGKSGSAPGKNKPTGTKAAEPESRGSEKPGVTASEGKKLPPGQAKKQ